MSDDWPGRFGEAFTSPPPSPPHRYELGGEWASLLAQVDERCGADVARRIEALARSWAVQGVPDGQNQTRGQ